MDLSVSKAKICFCLCFKSLWIGQFIVIRDSCSPDILNLLLESLSPPNLELLAILFKLELTPAGITCHCVLC